MATRRGPKLKFPTPDDYKAGVPAVMCPYGRVLGLYNEKSGKAEAKRMSQTVRTWFATQAHTLGWAGVHFLTEVQTNYGIGCVLWRPPQAVNVQITVTNTTLVLRDSGEATA